ncbi:hypothetical protein BGW80DRAFT_1182116 [Lactifluus volemus]|nr:hypothetical protein BGW80DRAFT_1182116 [Lactifluus volemus]
MPSNQPTRLTKKQKKANAFRDRSHKGKGKAILVPVHSRRRPSTGDNLIGDDDDDEDALNAVPAMESQALAEMAGCTEGDEDTKTAVGVRTTKENERGKKRDSKKKRRRDDGDGRSSAPAAKKAKLVHGSQAAPIVTRKKDDTADVEDDDGGSEHESENTTNKGSKQRYILFIGNLKYTTTREAIQNHFAMCDPPPTVRLLTPKVTRAAATVTKSKGCAFLEFSTRPALQVALKLHQSELDGRRINVELTAGGGGKGDARLTKVKARNKQLTAQRTRRLTKAGTAQGEADGVLSSQPQRFSTTSGEADVPRTKRTWTVSDKEHGGEHRGGKKIAKKRGTRSKSLGTGVNAMPLG